MTYDLGFLGGGQLARMSIQAAQRMGLRCLSLDPGEATPASQIADSVQGELSDPTAIAKVTAACDRITLENEFIPASAIREALAKSGRTEECLIPGVGCLETIQDKLTQREALLKADVPSPFARSFHKETWTKPQVLKARFGGYDGKGTRYARSQEEWERNTADLLDGWLIEDFVPFKRELAVMVFVGPLGHGSYPAMETIQTNHVCDLVFPIDSPAIDAKARAVAIAAVEAVGGQGLFGVELFECENGDVLVNEIAPRPHNTGHYTLDWGGTSQFEQHVRLAMGFPYDLETVGQATCMANVLGTMGVANVARATAAALEVKGAHCHWYGKAEMRPGRKMGHINVVGTDNLVEDAIRARERFLENI